MAEGKKSFILYCDQRGIFDKLSDEQAGKLIKHIFSYVSDENPQSDFVTELAFESIKQQLKRDLKKYENYVTKQRENGKKGGRPKAKKPNPFLENPTKPKKADTVNVNVTDTVNVSSKEDDNAARFFADNELNDVFNKWLKMLDERKKPMTQSSIEALAMKLNRQPVEYSVKQIEQSLENNWLTLRAVDIQEQQSEKDMQAGQIMKELKRQALEESLYGNNQKRIGDERL